MAPPAISGFLVSRSQAERNAWFYTCRAAGRPYVTIVPARTLAHVTLDTVTMPGVTQLTEATRQRLMHAFHEVMRRDTRRHSRASMIVGPENVGVNRCPLPLALELAGAFVAIVNAPSATQSRVNAVA